MTAPMPETMSPREKVAQIIKDKVSGPHFTDPSHFVAMEQDRFAAADAILAALALSGDHAELAQLAEAATSRTDGGEWKADPYGIRQIWAKSLKGGDTHIADIRGWGYLTGGGHGALGLSDDEGLEAQRQIAAFIAAANPATVLSILTENAALRAACSKSNDEISQTLGKALGYPWFKDDQINFPGATAENGVCVGDHVAESLADEAARRLTEAERKLAEAEETSTRWAIRFAELRKAAGIGVKPMLSDVPGELRKMRSLIDRAAELMQQCTDPERFEGSSTLNVYANMRAWLSDLSKEAERG